MISYSNQVKAVGEKLVVNFTTNNAPWTVNGTKRTYDFVIQDNFIVTSLKISKIVDDTVSDAEVAPSNCLSVTVLKVSNTGVETEIARSSLTGTGGQLGAQQIAGVEILYTDPALIPVELGNTIGYTNIFMAGTVGDPEIAVRSQAKVSGTANSQQLIRLVIEVGPRQNEQGSALWSALGVNPDCVIEVDFAKFVEDSLVPRTTQSSEIITPPVVAETYIPPR